MRQLFFALCGSLTLTVGCGAAHDRPILDHVARTGASVIESFDGYNRIVITSAGGARVDWYDPSRPLGEPAKPYLTVITPCNGWEVERLAMLLPHVLAADARYPEPAGRDDDVLRYFRPGASGQCAGMGDGNYFHFHGAVVAELTRISNYLLCEAFDCEHNAQHHERRAAGGNREADAEAVDSYKNAVRPLLSWWGSNTLRSSAGATVDDAWNFALRRAQWKREFASYTEGFVIESVGSVLIVQPKEKARSANIASSIPPEARRFLLAYPDLPDLAAFRAARGSAHRLARWHSTTAPATSACRQ